MMPVVVWPAPGVVAVVAFVLSEGAVPLVVGLVPAPLLLNRPLIRALLPCSEELVGETCSPTFCSLSLEPQRGDAAALLSPETPYTTTTHQHVLPRIVFPVCKWSFQRKPAFALSSRQPPLSANPVLALLNTMVHEITTSCMKTNHVIVVVTWQQK